ncbi:MAG: class I SAM-dependent methyltransferase [Desulfobacteraceae bacterium]|nr:class I SAM-dependent methyltransferase [Desulfobacteraceae bacterium]
MKIKDTISVHDQGAAQYDKQTHDYNSYGHDVLFGMSFEYVKPRDCLLDLGIGTGLASRLFAKLRLNIYGCDGSIKMLKMCESKAFATELKIFDLHDTPLPYSDSFFDHAICCGVLHFFDDLEIILKEVFRIIKPGGIFAFTIAAQTSAEAAATRNDSKGYFETPTPWGVSIFKHSSRYISNLLQDNGVDILKTQKFLIRGGPEDDSEDMLFSAFISCNKNPVGG